MYILILFTPEISRKICMWICPTNDKLYVMGKNNRKNCMKEIRIICRVDSAETPPFLLKKLKIIVVNSANKHAKYLNMKIGILGKTINW